MPQSPFHEHSDLYPDSGNPAENQRPSANANNPSLGEASGHLKGAVSEFIAAKLELASIEAKEAAEFTAKKAVHGVICALCGFFAWLLLLAGLVGLLAKGVDSLLNGKVEWLAGWVVVVILLGILHGIIALVFLKRLKQKPDAPLFELSRQELENDKRWLQKNR